ncbi:MAG: hypothetical protein ACJAXL_000820 [Alphaproteobacteria bacterium]|jgi:hypothetical protein
MSLKKNIYSSKSHIIFGAFIVFAIFAIGLYFKSTLLEVSRYLPFFSYSVSALFIMGTIYYFYCIMRFRRYNATYYWHKYSLSRIQSKSGRMYDVLQIIVAIISTTTIIILVYKIINIVKIFVNSANNNFDIDNPIIIQPFYCILIALIVISVFFLFSLRIKKIASKLENTYQTNNLNNDTAISQTSSLNNDRAFMSQTPSDNLPNNHTETSENIILPDYDHGFFYKKLFEINDNVLNLKRSIIIPQNDNVSEQRIETFWSTKIEPFLINISDRIAEIEKKLANNILVNAQNLSHKEQLDNIAEIPDNTAEVIESVVPNFAEITPHEKVENFKLATQTNQDTVKNDLDEDSFIKDLTHKIITQNQEAAKDAAINNQDNDDDDETFDLNESATPIHEIEDDEESFLHTPKTKTETKTAAKPEVKTEAETKAEIVQDQRNIALDIKEKTLEELKEFLEIKMQQLYDNEFSKAKQKNQAPEKV